MERFLINYGRGPYVATMPWPFNEDFPIGGEMLFDVYFIKRKEDEDDEILVKVEDIIAINREDAKLFAYDQNTEMISLVRKGDVVIRVYEKPVT